MSTRSVIARIGEHEGEFSGVYVHSDGYPTGRGPLLFQMIREEFKGDLKAALRFIIDEHPAGWSSLIPEYRACFCHPRRAKNRTDFKNRQPEPPQEFSHKNVVKGDTDVEWLYIFDEEQNRLYIHDVRNDAESIVELADGEPTKEQWTAIECGENFERCSHYAWAHGLAPKTCNLSTQTWLGRRPFDFNDVVAFVINGKRWTSTGSGGSSEFYSTPIARQHGFTKHFPPRTWIASVKSRNGRRMDVPVAKVTKDGYEPLAGVVWIYPPTKDNPQETMVSA